MERELERNHEMNSCDQCITRTLVLSSNSTQGPPYIVSSSEVRFGYRKQLDMVVPAFGLGNWKRILKYVVPSPRRVFLDLK